MSLKRIIRAQKENLDTGKWSVGHVPRTAFPMSRLKDKRYRYGPEYSWRLIKFEACGYFCRVLILLNESKEILRARLGIEINGDMVVLSDYEYHASEPGWHCHLTLVDVALVDAGSARSDKTKWPRKSSRQDFGANKANAVGIVATHFNFHAQGGLI